MSIRVVVVGSGIAGLTAALHAESAGCLVTIVTKTTVAEAATAYAQGGIAAAVHPGDSADFHAADTLTAGAGLADAEAVAVLTRGGAAGIAELIEAGVAFDRDADGALHQGLEAAHGRPRILHAGGDATGAAIQRALVAAVRARPIEVQENTALVDLVLRGGAVAGVELLRDGTHEIREADAVVLATGGAGQLYSHTTNPAVATGDGLAAALRAGAAVADLEFVQFHPTVLAGDEPFLVSEAVRGEGAVLVDRDGRRFAFDAHPAGELAPRDVVARAIGARMSAQGGEPVFLDATALGGAFLAQRFPTIDAAVRRRGFDWSRTPLPVTPAAHYVMGGVVTDLHGRTTVPGLYAAGEVARTGVHGANRLASNSLLEGGVFGARVGHAVLPDRARPWHGPRPPQRTPVPAVSAVVVDRVPFTRRALQQRMWEDAGLVRDAAGLSRAAASLASWRRAAPRRTPRTVTELEDRNLLLVAAEVVQAALARAHSVGAHHRSDAPPAVSERPPVPHAASVLGAA